MKKIRGFTLIELVIVLALVAVIAGFAVPSFSQLIANNRLVSSTNNLIGAINFARAEAVKRGGSVSVSAVAPSGNANEWGGGWRIWVDQDSDGAFDAGEELRVFTEVNPRLTIDGPDGVTSFGFRPNGFVNPAPAAGTEYGFQVCDDRSGEAGRLMQIHRSGRIRTTTVACG